MRCSAGLGQQTISKREKLPGEGSTGKFDSMCCGSNTDTEQVSSPVEGPRLPDPERFLDAKTLPPPLSLLFCSMRPAEAVEWGDQVPLPLPPFGKQKEEEVWRRVKL